MSSTVGREFEYIRLANFCFYSESLKRIINKRIGVDLFQEKLESLSKSEYYAKAIQKPQLQLSKPTDMILDYEFTRLCKILEGSIAHMLTKDTNDEQAKLSDQASKMLTQYSDLIQQQNQQIDVYQHQEKQFLEERHWYQNKITELERTLHDIHDQYTSLKLSSEQSERLGKVFFSKFICLLGQDSQDGLRTSYEQQHIRLEYLTNMMVKKKNQVLLFNNCY